MKNLQQVEAYVFDMDGTLYTGETLIPGAAETLQALLDRGKRVCYFTNNSSRCGSEYEKRVKAFGLPILPVLTSGDVALDYVKKRYPGKKLYVFGTKGLKSCFTKEFELAEEGAEVAVMGFHTEMVYADLVKLCNLLRQGVPFVATHPDPSCPAEPFPVPDVGSFLKLVETSTGRTPEAVCGKPSKYAGEFLMRALNLPPEKIAFAGDRYSTDILLGKNNGFFSIHVATGAKEADEQPADLELSSIHDLYRMINVEL